VDWNNKINLTAITDETGIATKHFLDSLTAIKTGYVSGKVIDVGTGAGFPGLVLKIAKPDIELTLLDSLNKRIKFLQTVSDELSLENIEFVHSRAEDGGMNRAYRGKFDTVVSRAVANMTVLSEWCLPFLKVDGRFLALKGPLADQELADAKRAISILGGEVEDVFEVEIPFTDLAHKIIIVKKVRQTPMKYPRKPGIAAKNPIEQCYNLKK
jgi:16S rRNA (guanine527-N7)-methyltransferase